MYPGSVTSKKTIEWGYFSDDDDKWKAVDKSSINDEVEGLEKLVGFVGKYIYTGTALHKTLPAQLTGWMEPLSFIYYHYFSYKFLTLFNNLAVFYFFILFETGIADPGTGYYCHYDDGRLRVGEETSYDINAQQKPRK